MFGLGEWSAKWTFERPMPSELDTDVLMWWMQQRIDRDRTPDQRTVVQFVFPDVQRRYWFVIEPTDVSMCVMLSPIAYASQRIPAG